MKPVRFILGALLMSGSLGLRAEEVVGTMPPVSDEVQGTMTPSSEGTENLEAPELSQEELALEEEFLNMASGEVEGSIELLRRRGGHNPQPPPPRHGGGGRYQPPQPGHPTHPGHPGGHRPPPPGRYNPPHPGYPGRYPPPHRGPGRHQPPRYASYQCTLYLGGYQFYGSGYTQRDAAREALRACQYNAGYYRNQCYNGQIYCDRW